MQRADRAESCKQQKMPTCPARDLQLPAIISEVSLFCRCMYCERDLCCICAAAGIWRIVCPNATDNDRSNAQYFTVLIKI